jgi:hypothetical protein
MAGSRAHYTRSREGERGRQLTIKERLLAELRDKNPHYGNDLANKLGRRFGGRIQDLRDEKHLIHSWKVGDDWAYQLEWLAEEVTPERYAFFAKLHPESLPKPKGDTVRKRLEKRIAKLERTCRSREVALVGVIETLGGIGVTVSKSRLDELSRAGVTVSVLTLGDSVVFSPVAPEVGG